MKKTLLLAFAICFFFRSIAQSPKILVPFRAGKHWGYSDTLGRIKIQPQFDSAALFKYSQVKNGNAIAAVQQKGRPMVVNDKGAVILPAKYDEFGLIHELEDFAFVVSKGKKWGVYTKGKEIIPPVYDVLFMVRGNYFQVQRDGKWGLFNAAGKEMMPVVYKEMWDDAYQPGFVTLHTSENGELKTYSFKEEPTYYYSSEIPTSEMVEEGSDETLLKENIAFATKEYGLDSVQVRKGFAMIYKKEKQGILLPGEKPNVHFFSTPYLIHNVHCFSPAQKNDRNKGLACIIASIDGKYGILNETEYPVLPFVYDSIEEKADFFLLKQNGKTGFFIWNTPYPFIKPAYDLFIRKHIVPVNGNWVFTLFEVMKNGKRGFVGENGIAFFRE